MLSGAQMVLVDTTQLSTKLEEFNKNILFYSSEAVRLVLLSDRAGQPGQPRLGTVGPSQMSWPLTL